MASKAIEEKKHEMEATMVNLGDKVGSNIQQGLTNLPAGVMNRRAEGSDYQAELFRSQLLSQLMSEVDLISNFLAE